MGRAFQQDKDIRELSWHAEGIILFPMFLFFCFFLGFLGGILRWGNVGTKKPFRGWSEALGLLHEAGLGRQRHEGRGQAPEADPGAKAEVRGGQ